MNEFVRRQGAEPQETLLVFKASQRRWRANSSYPSDGEMAASDFVSALDRATSPLFARFLVSFCHFGRQNLLLYETMT